MPSKRPTGGNTAARRMHRRLLSRIYALCRSGKWGLRYAKLRRNRSVHAHVGRDLGADRFLWDAVGCVDTARHIIYVDYRFDVLSTFVHECLHVIIGRRYLATQDKNEEREVQRLEALMMRHMTPRQARRLHTEMALLLHADADDIDPEDRDD